jgi:hypothetical protein
MRWAADETTARRACGAVLAFMHRHAVATTWGRSDLASSDMMSLETAKRVWQARLDPRRQTPSMGLYKRQDKIRFIAVRHEEAAAFMASGYAKPTVRLGVCLAPPDQAPCIC